MIQDDRQFNSALGRGYVAALLCFVLSTAIVALAYQFSQSYVIQSTTLFRMSSESSIGLNNHDGQWYKSIVLHGYFNEASPPGNCAFFPMYPTLAKVIVSVLGVTVDISLIIVSNFLLFVDFGLLTYYINLRKDNYSSTSRFFALASFALMPANFFLHMGYSESSFLAILLLYLIILKKNGNTFFLAFLLGLLTATRSPGIALIPSLVIELWRRQPHWKPFLGRFLTHLPISCWGLLEFMGFQYAKTGDPLAFVAAQTFFKGRPTPPPLEKFIALVSFEPIFALFDVSKSPLLGTATKLYFNLGFYDPIIFLLFISLVAFGFYFKVITFSEATISLCLMLFTYASIGYESYMRSQARYCSVVVPAYLVLGKLLSSIAGQWSSALLITASLLLFVLSCLFISGYFLV